MIDDTSGSGQKVDVTRPITATGYGRNISSDRVVVQMSASVLSGDS